MIPERRLLASNSEVSVFILRSTGPNSSFDKTRASPEELREFREFGAENLLDIYLPENLSKLRAYVILQVKIATNGGPLPPLLPPPPPA